MKIDYSKIWQEIGDAFETPDEERTRWQKRITQSGLCFAISLATERKGNIPFLYIRIEMNMYGYWFQTRLRESEYHKKFYQKNDLIRADFAYLMAAMGNREYEKLIKAVS